MKISVIIPSTDAAKAKQALRSVKSQNGPVADEVIIVGRNLADLYGISGENVRIVNEPRWLNAAAARNTGAGIARGGLLFFMDDDCIAAGDWITSNLEALLDKPEIGAALGRLVGKSDKYFSRCVDLSGFWVQQNSVRKYVNGGYAASLAISRDLFQRMGGFNSKMDMVEDCDLYARIRNAGYKIVYEPKITVYHDHGKDTLKKLVSFMYEGGRNYRRYFMPEARIPSLIGGIITALMAALLNWIQALRVNKNIYPGQYLYAPGVFVGFLAWHLGLNRNPLPRKNLDTLIFFITGDCNLSCRHCFYWKQLNKHNDISFDEIRKGFGSFGKIRNLLLSGGEPFLRKDILEICRFFRENNKIEFLSIPTNGFLPEVIEAKVEEILNKLDIPLTVGLSLDGMNDYHDTLRGREGSFNRVIETYHKLSPLKKSHPGFTITVNPVVTMYNVDEIVRLAGFVKEEMPEIDYFWLCIARGNPKSPDQTPPDTMALRNLYKKINEIFYKNRRDIIPAVKIWDRIFEMKMNVLERKIQVVPCQAGNLIGVLDANGDVRACELREAFGNIKEQEFLSIWNSYLADLMRESIKNKDCYCTHECFIYPSVMRYYNLRPVSIFLRGYKSVRHFIYKLIYRKIKQ